MIRLLFTGTTPWFVAAVLMLASVVFTIWIYSKHALPRPWSRILPLVRILALWLIALMLLQPVLGIFHSETLRGKIPVVIDNSGSMSLIDQYEDEEKIDVGWFLELYDPKLRHIEFESFPDELESIDKEFDQLAEALAESEPKDAWKAARREFEDLRQRLEKKRDELTRLVEDSDYLTEKEKEAEEEEEESDNEEWNDRLTEFRKVYTPWMKRFNDLTEEVRKWEKRLEEKTEDEEKPSILNQAEANFKGIQQRWKKLPETCEEAQRLSDRCLYVAGNEEVDAAMERLAEMNRRDLVEYLLTEEPFQMLDEWQSKGDVLVYQLNEPIEPVNEQEKRSEAPTDLPATRIGTVLQGIAKSYEGDPVAGFVILGDGNVNAGRDFAETREILNDQDIPIYSIGMGKVEPPDDIAISRIFHPDTSFKDENVNAAVILKRKGYTDRPVRLKVLRDDKVIHEQNVDPGEENQLRVEVSFEEEEAGLHHYHIEAETLDGEAFDTNNEKRFTVNVLSDRIKTLVIDQYPRWETRYMNMMLSRDKRVDLKTMFLGSLEPLEDETEDGEKEPGPLEKGGYPKTKEGLFAYHLIVLGDVAPQYFRRQQLEDIRDFVMERGGTLIAVAGENHMPVKFADGPLRNVLPVSGRNVGGSESEENQGDRGFAEVPLKLKPASEFEPVLQVGVDPEITRELWEKLPPMIWARSGVRPATHSEVLVEDDKDERPVLLHAYAGQGKVLYLGSDSFWRWRDRSRWKYHHRFWGQVLLWATLGRTTGSGKYVKLMPSEPEYMPDQPVVLRARVLDDQGEALEDASVTGEIYDENDELVKRMQFTWLENSGGEYRVEVQDLPKGEYRVVPTVLELKDKKLEAEAKFAIQDLPTSEFVELALDELQLRENSDEYFPMEKIRDLMEVLEEKTETRERRDDIVLWDSFPYLALVVALLGFEWWMRKKHQLV